VECTTSHSDGDWRAGLRDLDRQRSTLIFIAVGVVTIGPDPLEFFLWEARSRARGNG
jgi:hypothetical protein